MEHTYTKDLRRLRYYRNQLGVPLNVNPDGKLSSYAATAEVKRVRRELKR